VLEAVKKFLIFLKGYLNIDNTLSCVSENVDHKLYTCFDNCHMVFVTSHKLDLNVCEGVYLGKLTMN